MSFCFVVLVVFLVEHIRRDFHLSHKTISSSALTFNQSFAFFLLLGCCTTITCEVSELPDTSQVILVIFFGGVSSFRCHVAPSLPLLLLGLRFPFIQIRQVSNINMCSGGPQGSGVWRFWRKVSSGLLEVAAMESCLGGLD